MVIMRKEYLTSASLLSPEQIDTIWNGMLSLAGVDTAAVDSPDNMDIGITGATATIFIQE